MKKQGTMTVPAPWALMGTGYIILLKMSRAYVKDACFVPESLKDSFAGGLGTVMYVDYHYSDAGPYQELLFIPGRFNCMSKKFFSITKIYVSTRKSVVSGKNNWGIPKEFASFERESLDKSSERISVSHKGKSIAELTFRSWPLQLPVTTTLVPRAWHTLCHYHDGRTLLTTPTARGCVSPSRLIDSRIDSSFFPDITKGCILSALKVSNFFMVFPKAETFAV